MKSIVNGILASMLLSGFLIGCSYAKYDDTPEQAVVFVFEHMLTDLERHGEFKPVYIDNNQRCKIDEQRLRNRLDKSDLAQQLPMMIGSFSEAMAQAGKDLFSESWIAVSAGVTQIKEKNGTLVIDAGYIYATLAGYSYQYRLEKHFGTWVIEDCRITGIS